MSAIAGTSRGPVKRRPRGATARVKREAVARAVAAAESGKPMKMQGPLDDARHERFVQGLMRESSATAAAIRAGYAPRSAAVSASRLLRNDKIRDRLASLHHLVGYRRVARKRDMLRQLTDHMQWAMADLADLAALPASEFAQALRRHPAGRWVRQVEYHPPRFDPVSNSWSEITVKKITMIDAHQSRRLLADLMGWTAREDGMDSPAGAPSGILVVPEGRLVEIREAPGLAGEAVRRLVAAPDAQAAEAEIEPEEPAASKKRGAGHGSKRSARRSGA